jgi:LuxR family transcriptional regulator, maltose regulon positive regulatory protein
VSHTLRADLHKPARANDKPGRCGRVYAADMPAAAPFSPHDVAQMQNWRVVLPLSRPASRVRSSDGTWAIRRAIVRARSALLRARLAEAAEAIAQLNRLLSNRAHSDQLPYSRVSRILQACRLAASDDFTAARNELATLPALQGDIVSATILRYVGWKSDAGEACTPEAFDYLSVPTRAESVYEILNLCMSAAMAFDRLHLTVAATLAREALQSAQQHYGNHSPMSCLPATLLAQVAYEQGRREEAEALLAPRLQMIRASGLPECLMRATVLLARLSFHRGQHRTASTMLREAEALGRVRNWPRLVSVASSEHARMSLLRRYEETPGPKRCASADSVPVEPMPLQGFSPGDTPQFSAVAATLGRLAAAASRGCGNDCYDPLISCLRIGAAHGLRLIFVDAGRPIVELLKGLYCTLAANATPTSDLRAYIATILKVTGPIATADAPAPTYRQLSRRETGILKLIARGMSNKHIALSLGITPETVKTHTKSIFVKLGTRTRAQAVARAEGGGWL